MGPTSGEHTGVVLRVKQAGSYTYLQIDTPSEGRLLVAGPKVEVEMGARVRTPAGGLIMRNFTSPSSGDKFERVDFVQSIVVEGHTHDVPDPHAAVAPKPDTPKSLQGHDTSRSNGPPQLPKQAITLPAPTGDVLTVAQVFAQRDALAGKSVTVRGQVIKFSAQIMDRNWIHLQDGTEHQGLYDLTLTTADTVKVGDVVHVSGVVAIDRDFGAGYRYGLLIEEAKVSVQTP